MMRRKARGVLAIVLVGILWHGSMALADAPPAKPAPPKLSSAELAAWLDDSFAKLWTNEGVTPAPVIDDAAFIRRVSLDLVGAVPAVADLRDFLADSTPDKRAKLIRKLLDDPRHAPHMGNTWRRVMISKGSTNNFFGPQFDSWLTKQFAEKKRYDEIATSILTVSGNYGGDGAPTAFYFAVGNEVPAVAAAATRVFLGVRIECAQCHAHPFASWEQKDFWGMAAFFAGVNPSGRKDFYVVADGKQSTIKPPDSKVEYAAKFLWDGPAKIAEGAAPREVLAEWMIKNPYFAATAVNRTWQQLFGRGLAHPVDDLDLIDPAERLPVLDELAGKFRDASFDLRWLIQGICESQLYQRSSESSTAIESPELFTHMALKTLTPEQVFSVVEQVLAYPTSADGESPRFNGKRQQLITRLDDSVGDSPEQFRASIPQALTMMNGELVAGGANLADSQTLRAIVDAPFMTGSAKIQTLYLAALTRPPRRQELQTLLEYVGKRQTKAEQDDAYANIFWALLNSPEFVLNH